MSLIPLKNNDFVKHAEEQELTLLGYVNYIIFFIIKKNFLK